VGRNAFAHEAGIHQDGILKDRRTYEIMRPEDVGVPEMTLVLGKHSGRHALKNRCAALRIEPTRLELDELYKRMIALADRKKIVRDDDLFDLWSAMKRAPRAKAPVLRLLREEAAPAEEAGYGHGV
jgi:2-isopropylmalate synthase